MNELFFNRRRKLQLLSSFVLPFSWTQLVKPAQSAPHEDLLNRNRPGRLRLSLAAYSMRKYLELKGQSDHMTLFEFIDWSHSLGLDGVELTSYYFAETSASYIAKLRTYCQRLGITISGGAIRNDFCQKDDQKRESDIKQSMEWIDRYSDLGVGAIRFFAGNQPSDEQWPETLKRCVDSFQRVGEYAMKKGVSIAIENHGGVTARSAGLLDIIRSLDSPIFGVNFDSGNFRSSDNPYQELEEIAPYAINAQIKVEMFPNGVREEADLSRVLSILKAAGYSGWVALEYEADEEPKTAIPRYIGRLKELLS
jgi:sugar phosphate isomerase/epimerase